MSVLPIDLEAFEAAPVAREPFAFAMVPHFVKREAMAAINDRVGTGLGLALDHLLQTARLKRAVVAGGDTSGHALQAMGIYALTAVAPLASGEPVCSASSDRVHAQIEIALKGVQVGDADLFCVARDGRK